MYLKCHLVRKLPPGHTVTHTADQLLYTATEMVCKDVRNFVWHFVSRLKFVSGLRMLDQPYMTDLIEANSMGHKPQSIHIYSASWGPTDDGKTVDGPRNATMRAIVKGVNEVANAQNVLR